MKLNKGRRVIIIFIFLVLVSCKQYSTEKSPPPVGKSVFCEIIEEDYTLFNPSQQTEAVLILFGGYFQDAVDIKRAFKILDLAKENNIAVVLSNFNQKLWLEEQEKHQLAKSLQNIFEKYQLPVDHIFIGGFSSGGNVSLLMSNFIVGMKQFYIDPKGVFIVDAPIDLEALYHSSKKNIERNFSETSVRESTWLLATLETNFGNPGEHLQQYEKNAVFTLSTDNTFNLKRLKNTKIRLYTEPDTLWWKEQRKADYDQMNAFYIHELNKSLKRKGFNKVEYLPSTNKGYRPDGTRHPHSWSIIDQQDLVNWMLTE